MKGNKTWVAVIAGLSLITAFVCMSVIGVITSPDLHEYEQKKSKAYVNLGLNEKQMIKLMPRIASVLTRQDAESINACRQYFSEAEMRLLYVVHRKKVALVVSAYFFIALFAVLGLLYRYQFKNTKWKLTSILLIELVVAIAIAILYSTLLSKETINNFFQNFLIPIHQFPVPTNGNLSTLYTSRILFEMSMRSFRLFYFLTGIAFVFFGVLRVVRHKKPQDIYDEAGENNLYQ